MSFLLPCGQATTLESQNFGGFFTLMGFQSQLVRIYGFMAGWFYLGTVRLPLSAPHESSAPSAQLRYV